MLYSTMPARFTSLENETRCLQTRTKCLSSIESWEDAIKLGSGRGATASRAPWGSDTLGDLTPYHLIASFSLLPCDQGCLKTARLQ